MWDERYKTDHYIYGTEPNDFLADNINRIAEHGQVLCLADGEGRNSVYLAKQGFQVSAVDLSIEGINKARRLAAENQVEVDFIHADLAEFDPGSDKWDAIVSIFCHLPPDIRQSLHRKLLAALKPGGMLILEAYTPEQLKHGTGGPPVAEMTMSKQALMDELDGLEFNRLEELEREVIEGTHHTGLGAVIQVIASRPG